MANKTIGQLTAKTTPSSADVFALEDTEDTKKINYDALADAILNKITSKNYTVAGSSQTLINAINTLNSKSSNGGINSYVEYYTNTDANTHSTAGIRYYGGGCANVPSEYVYIVTMQSDASGDISQVAFGISADIYRRYGRKDGSYFSEWKKVPNRAEFDALNSKTAKVFIYEISTDAGNSNWKLEAQSGYNFPSVLIFGANGSLINQTIQILGSGVDSIFHGDNSKNLLPVKISNAAFSITVWEYARLSIVSRTPLTITKITS